MEEIKSFKQLLVASLGSLRGKLVLIFVGLSLAVATITSIFGWFAAREASESLTKQAAAQTTNRIAAYVDEYTHEAVLIGGGTKAAFDSGHLPTESETAWEQYLWQSSLISENVRYAYFGSESGMFVGVERGADPDAAQVKIRKADSPIRATYSARNAGDRTQRIGKDDLQYDPRTRPWYIQAKEKGGPIFTEPYLSNSKKKYVVTYAVPLIDRQGALQGVIAFDFFLDKLSAYVHELPPSANGAIIVKSAAGATLVQSEFGAFADADNKANIIRTLREQPVPKEPSVRLEDGTLFSVSHLSGAINGAVAVAIPSLDLRSAARKSAFKIMGLAAVLVALAIVVGMYSLRSVMQDLTTLRRAAKKLELGSETIALPVTRNDEIGALARTYEAMRNRVRGEIERSQSQYEARNADLERSDDERRRLAVLVDAVHECIALVTAEGKFSYVNEAFAKEMGAPVEALVGLPARASLSDRRSPAMKRVNKAIRARSTVRETISIVRRDGALVHFEVTLTPLPSRDNRIEWALIGRNVTESVQRANELARRANFDPVSKLMRRAAMLEILQERMIQSKVKPFSLLFIDLDGFKPINDTFGHQAGDQVVAQVGEHLREHVRDDDMSARFGGDEFLVSVSDDDHEASAAVVGERIVGMLSRFGEAQFPGAKLSASIGVVSYPRDGQTLATLILRADQAMYAAKNDGGGCVRAWNALDGKGRNNVVGIGARRPAKKA